MAYYDALKRIVHQFGMEEDVIFTGRVSLSEYVTYYAVADVFLCMSEHEGFCIPLVTENTYAMHLFAGAWNDTARDDMTFFGSVADYVTKLINGKKISADAPVFIFGTGTVGNLVLEALRMNGCEPKGFIVSKRDTAWTEIDGIPIYEMAECGGEIKKENILISILPKEQKGICDALKGNNFKKLICIGERL